MEALEGGPRPSMLEVVTTWQQPQRKSAYEHTPVNVLTESWYARGPLVSLQFSRTKMGITAQQLLFAFEDGTLLALDSRQIDPRRRKMRPVPVKGKMPPPVSPVLPTPPTSMLTMDKRVTALAAVD